MKTKELSTPNFILNLDVLENNIKTVQELSDKNKKELWPMTKTHKSSAIAKMQIKYGAKGLLVGTVDEAESFIKAGVKEITFPYPIANPVDIKRVIDLTKRGRVILSFDNVESAKIWNEMLVEVDSTLEYFILINSGLNRLGVLPEDCVWLAKKLSEFKNLKLIGISTHPGHVYGITSGSGVAEISRQEIATMSTAKNLLVENGFEVDVVASGSTPTFFDVVDDEALDVLRPGNYVFYDNIQLSLDVCKEEDCSLTALGTIISRPSENLFIVDVGSKCLGLDKGAHGSALITGFGRVKGHNELSVIGLSEEVGKIQIEGDTDLSIGDKIEIIPNHSCSCLNMTSYVVGYRGDEVSEIIDIDVRGNSKKPVI
ncbi:alanine racemase [Metaclostridioides mangenotii]|uniref:D-serine deaminase-like pyridoxal phosphate-dependent protein n=1 Tax=Metaclostridioides mangenotii TaxID=1540 RepID=A0ABS4E9K3_9FIRM|nr:alanine racemase [Clostridioides mangenotii]MBP1854626.1 D-serine deaminase-like pyridoxal phosphate-dependent protein [Clostridioides mangenotii]